MDGNVRRVLSRVLGWEGDLSVRMHERALTDAAQLLIGVSLGVRFTPAFAHTAPRWLGSIALASFVMMGLCAGFGWVMAQLTGQLVQLGAIQPALRAVGVETRP